MNAQLKPTGCVIRDEPADLYHMRSLEIASASGMKEILRSPAHFKHWAENPEDDKESAALTFGRAFHCATLEPDVFASTYTVTPADAPSYPTQRQWDAKKPSPDSVRAMDWWLAWEAENKGRILLSTADYDRAQKMAESVRAHPVAAGLLMGGEREVTFRWTDDVTGVKCKARADLYAPGEFLMDLKTCRDASPEGFGRAVASYSYDLQQAHYIDGIRSAGDRIRWFVFLAVESFAPFVCQPHVLDVKAEERGHALRMTALRRQAECLHNNRWPGYSDRLNELSLPAWAYYGIEEVTQ